MTTRQAHHQSKKRKEGWKRLDLWISPEQQAFLSRTAPKTPMTKAIRFVIESARMNDESI